MHQPSLRSIGGPRAACTVAFAAAIALAGCAPNTYIPLTPEYASAITTTRVHATIAQDEVDPVVVVQNTPLPGSIGLIGALVGAIVDAGITSHRERDANNLVALIRQELTDLDFRAAFFDELQRTLPSLRLLRTARLTTSKLPSTPQVQAVLRDRIAEDTLLQLTTNYILSADFRAFSVVTTAEISRRGEVDPVYRATFTYVTDAIATSDEATDAARAWAANHAAAMHTAMREGIAETMKMLMLDLGPGGAAAFATAATPGPPTATAPHGREIVRRHNGMMYSAPHAPPTPPPSDM